MNKNKDMIKIKISAIVLLLVLSIQGTEQKNPEGNRPQSASDKYRSFMMIIDLEHEETPNNDTRALTYTFATGMGLKPEDKYLHYEPNFPRVAMLVSSSIIYNFMTCQKEPRSHFDKVGLAGEVDWESWRIYLVSNMSLNKLETNLHTTSYVTAEDSYFFLFIPKEYPQNLLIERPENAISFQQLYPLLSSIERSSDHTKKDHSTLGNLKRLFKFDNTKKEDSILDILKNVFKLEKSDTASSPIWNIIIHGHGQKNSIIGGLSIENMQKVLLFLNNNINVGTLLIESCSAGGINSSLLQLDQTIGNNTLIQLHYTLIIGSISDEPTYADNASSTKWMHFFSKASSEESLADIIKILNVQQKSKLDPFGSANIPQVWIPGGFGFQTYQVDKRIKIISKALTIAHEDENRPIEIPQETEVVLVYPQVVNVPLILRKPWPEFISMMKTLDKKDLYFKELILDTKADASELLKEGTLPWTESNHRSNFNWHVERITTTSGETVEYRPFFSSPALVAHKISHQTLGSSISKTLKRKLHDIAQGKQARYASYLDTIKAEEAKKEEEAQKKLEEQRLAQAGWFERLKRWLFQSQKEPTKQPPKTSILQEIIKEKQKIKT